MAEWIDARERLPENNWWLKYYIVVVFHAESHASTGKKFVVPAQYNSKQKMWVILWGPEESEHLNALIRPEESQPDENCVAYWMPMPELPEELRNTEDRKMEFDF